MKERSEYKGKDKKKMTHYCVFVWTKEPILGRKAFWPKYGSTKNWLCQDLNFYVSSKTPFSQEGSDYTSCWVQQRTEHLFTLKVEQVEREETGDEKPPKAIVVGDWGILRENA